MSLKTYELELQCGKVVQLRLTALGIKRFEKEHGIPGAAPVVNVMNAAGSMDTMIELLTTALKFNGAPRDQLQSGADLIDLLADEGKGEDFLLELVVELAADAGLLKAEDVPEMKEAMLANSIRVKRNIVKVFLDRFETGGSTGDGETEENPT